MQNRGQVADFSTEATAAALTSTTDATTTATNPSTAATTTTTTPPTKRWNPLPPLGTKYARVVTEDDKAQQGTWDQRLLRASPPNEATLRASSVEDIKTALMALRDANRWKPGGQAIDQYHRVVQLVQHLLGARDYPASLFIYECIASALADPQGSATGLRKLLDDMTEQGMRPTASLCRRALEALMNHPDYALRHEVLGVMQQHWFTIDTSVRQTIVVGMLRDGQYELAYTRLVDMIDKGARIHAWVYDIFILVFGRLGFLDEMLLLLYRRKGIKKIAFPSDPSSSSSSSSPRNSSSSSSSSSTVIDSLLYYALDVCSQASHHAGTSFAWSAAVKNSRLQPPDGMVENVLATAARKGDAQLATEALDLLSTRGRLQAHHYDAVVDAFAASGDIAAALRTLGIMRDNGMAISRARVQSVRKALREHPELVRAAEDGIREMAGLADAEGDAAGGKSAGPPQPLVGVVIEALAETAGSHERAMQLYREVPRLCGGQMPEPEMMQDVVLLLLRLDDRGGGAGKAVLREYKERVAGESDPARNASTYGQLTTACLAAGEMDLAFRFAWRAIAGEDRGGGRERFAWVRDLVEKAAEGQDGRIWPIVDELGRSGDEEMREMIRKMLQRERIAKMAAEWRGRGKR